MGRMRIVKYELRTDETVAEWPIPARYAFVLLLGYLDDDGRGLDNARLLKADLYPLDDNVSAKAVAGFVDLWEASGVICRYEADGKRCLHAVNWTRHQRINRPTPSRLGPCPIHDSDSDDSVSPHDGLTDDSLSPHTPKEEVGSGKEEVGNGKPKGKREAPSGGPRDPALTRLIDQAGQLHPLIPRADLEQIIEQAFTAYQPDDIVTALESLRSQRFKLTFNTLRIELEGLPPTQNERNIARMLDHARALDAQDLAAQNGQPPVTWTVERADHPDQVER